MIRFLAIQHTFSEFFGSLETRFEQRDIGFVYQRPVVGQDIAASALQFDALWLLGGDRALTDSEHCPWLDDERRLVRIFRQARRPVVGLGFGGQLVAESFGGTAHDQPEFDARWARALKTAAGEGDPLAEAVHGREVLVLANGRVDLAPGVEPILVDEAGRWLAVRPDPLAYGLLFRPELKPGMIEDMIMEGERPLPDDIGDLLDGARSRWDDMQETADRVAQALVSALDLMQERRKMPVFKLNVPDARE